MKCTDPNQGLRDVKMKTFDVNWQPTFNFIRGCLSPWAPCGTAWRACASQTFQYLKIVKDISPLQLYSQQIPGKISKKVS